MSVARPSKTHRRASRRLSRRRVHRAREIAEEFNAAVAGARGRSMPLPSRRPRMRSLPPTRPTPRAARRPGVARRHPARHQGPVRHRGRRHDRGQPASSKASSRRTKSTVSGNLRKAGRGDARQAEHGRVRDGLVQRDQRLRAGDQPVEAQRRRQCRADPGRLVGRIGGGGRGAALRPGATGTDTGGSIRQPAAFTGICGIKPTYGRCSRWGIVAFASLARPGRADGADGPRLRDHARSDGRVRPEGFDLARSAGARVGSGFVERSQGQARRHSEGISHRRRARRRSTRCGTRASNGCRTPAPRSVEISLPHTKYALPTYYIIAPAEASSNLARYDGVRYGLRDRRRRAAWTTCTPRPAPPASARRSSAAS